MTRETGCATAAGAGHYATDIAAFQQDLRCYLAELDWADQWRDTAAGTSEEILSAHGEILARLHTDGWNRYGWPEWAGGLGGNEIHRAIFYDELATALLPVPDQQWTLETLGPALIRFAPQLAESHLGAYLRGQEWWGQGFSEPEAGSDLAALRTRALDDGTGGLIVNGQKIWTSQGSTATRFLVLVRTGDADSRHRGLSMVLVDADAPGVTVRPIALASGRRELAEVFFDDVHVPRERLVGDLGAGWAVAMYLMQYERGMYGYAVLSAGRTQLSRLRATIVRNGASAAEKERFAQVHIAALAASARGAATVRQLAAGVALGPASSVDKLLFSKVEKDINDLVLDVRRDWMIASPDSSCGHAVDEARAHWWYTRAATVMGGTAEIQKSIIADHVLGLPKETK
ncbi:acyl-CoA dehydrogenase family protein [Mycolicibacterium sphagni]|uniref:acyl-CoA dehydrogenase family protein n=1 Tax=Mycolicibacterium sphagni TaxID=1786 RepID=UPI0021F2CE75|nr:acyl-CoA dehydrogenase family protein [Mycolicibacterium sphagni]MCV7177816.1 acyl-CoA dehydrogenase family protein [Mycolicibacterium sphagni]